jgi:DNA-binding LacI/PurR family transcriptional regulator
MEKLKSIEDIAQLAGVSKSTVSRALNDSPLVGVETKQRILDIAKDHDFHPSVMARNLSLRTSKTIAFVNNAYCKGACGVSDQFSLEIMGGIAIGLHELGYDLLVVHVSPDATDWVSQYLGTGRVDGFILMTSEYKRKHIDYLLSMKAPFIAWGPGRGGYSTVCGEDKKGGEYAAKRFIELGRSRAAFIGGPKIESEVQARHFGFASTLAEAGIPLDPELETYGHYSEMYAEEAMKAILAREPRVDCVFACSDYMAIAAMRVLRSSGRRVPEDVAVIGYDDLSLAPYVSPGLTTISQHIPLAGRMLAQGLVTLLETGTMTNLSMPVELVIRESA